MHIHSNQFDLNIQMYSLSAAARAEAKMAAERTRKRLMDGASALMGDYDDAVDCVVRLSEDSTSGEHGNQRNRQNQGGQTKQKEQADGEDADNPFSGWA
jgi:hypothetical protein